MLTGLGYPFRCWTDLTDPLRERYGSTPGESCTSQVTREVTEDSPTCECLCVSVCDCIFAWALMRVVDDEVKV